MSIQPPEVDVEQLKAAAARVGRAMQWMVDRFAEPIREIGKTLQAVIDSLRAAWTTVSTTTEQLLRREYGAGNFLPDGRWQSDVCAAWLHGSCPFPEITHCCCTCHGGDLR